MKPFEQYSKYYNLLYKDKNYNFEVEYIDNIIKTIIPGNIDLLDIGCETGKHAGAFVEKGYNVVGIDVSETMLEEAKIKFGDRVNFYKGDIRNFSLGRTYNVITALFLMSYQVQNDDLESSFQSIYNHLVPKEIFIFDCWYGRGVLNDLPKVKVKRVFDNNFEVIRIAEPEIHYNECIVDVNYQILINDFISNKLTIINEKHSMRYLFKNEVELLAKKCKLMKLGLYAWPTFNEPTKNNYYSVLIYQK